MSIKMKLKYLPTISLAIFLSACNNQNNSVPIQSDSGWYTDEYQSTPSLTNTEALAIGATGVATGYALALAIGATGVATGYALGKYANKPRYSKPEVRVSRYKRK